MQNLQLELKKNHLFADIEEETLVTNILPHGKLRTWRRGESIFFAQDKVDMLYILLSGQVRMAQFFASGVKNLLGKISAPNLLALDLICTRTRISPYHAVAAEDVRAFCLPAKVLLAQGFVEERVRLVILEKLMMMLSDLNMQKEYRLAILTRNSLRERITIYLSMQAAKRGTNSFTIPFDREEMADFLSVNRSALSHELSLMQKEGLIDFCKNRFTLLRMEVAYPEA